MVRTLTNAIRQRPHRPCLHAHRRARRRQDHHRAHHRPRPQLRRARRQGRPDRRSPAASATTASRSPRTAMSTCMEMDAASRTGVDDMRELLDGVRYRPVERALQGLHHRRSAHALDQRLQRAAEDAGGAAGACEVHLRDHRDPQGAGDRAVALPALRSAPHRCRNAVQPLHRRSPRPRASTIAPGAWR